MGPVVVASARVSRPSRLGEAREEAGAAARPSRLGEAREEAGAAARPSRLGRADPAPAGAGDGRWSTPSPAGGQGIIQPSTGVAWRTTIAHMNSRSRMLQPNTFRTSPHADEFRWRRPVLVEGAPDDREPEGHRPLGFGTARLG